MIPREPFAASVTRCPSIIPQTHTRAGWAATVARRRGRVAVAVVLDGAERAGGPMGVVGQTRFASRSRSTRLAQASAGSPVARHTGRREDITIQVDETHVARGVAVATGGASIALFTTEQRVASAEARVQTIPRRRRRSSVTVRRTSDVDIGKLANELPVSVTGVIPAKNRSVHLILSRVFAPAHVVWLSGKPIKVGDGRIVSVNPNAGHPTDNTSRSPVSDEGVNGCVQFRGGDFDEFAGHGDDLAWKCHRGTAIGNGCIQHRVGVVRPQSERSQMRRDIACCYHRTRPTHAENHERENAGGGHDASGESATESAQSSFHKDRVWKLGRKEGETRLSRPIGPREATTRHRVWAGHRRRSA